MTNPQLTGIAAVKSSQRTHIPKATPVPDFVVDLSAAQVISADAVGRRFNRQKDEIYRLEGHFKQALAGALLLHLFHTQPWLKVCKFRLTPRSEYNDEGGSYRTVSLEVEDVIANTRLQKKLPAEVLNGGSFDPLGAADFIHEFLDEEAMNLHMAFRDEWDYTPISIVCRRTGLKTLLKHLKANVPVSGAQAFKALWTPEELETATSNDYSPVAA
jgi:hypothetical protein